MRRWLLYGSMAAWLLAFVALLNTGLWLKRLPGQADHFLQLIETIEEHVRAERWAEARAAARALEDEWQGAMRRLFTGTERRARNEVGEAIARLQAALQAGDPTATLLEIATVRYRWRELGT